jgi:hypothetical protein
MHPYAQESEICKLIFYSSSPRAEVQFVSFLGVHFLEICHQNLSFPSTRGSGKEIEGVRISAFAGGKLIAHSDSLSIITSFEAFLASCTSDTLDVGGAL